MSSVYFWDIDDGFAGVILLKKSTLRTTIHLLQVHAPDIVTQQPPRARVKVAGTQFMSSKLLTEYVLRTTSLQVR